MNDWRDKRACKDADPDIFYPPDGTPANYKTKATKAEEAAYAPAISICRDCPVINECASYALSVGEPAGMWGGLTPRERRILRRVRRAS